MDAAAVRLKTKKRRPPNGEWPGDSPVCACVRVRSLVQVREPEKVVLALKSVEKLLVYLEYRVEERLVAVGLYKCQKYW